MRLLLLIISAALLTGCAYNEISIYAHGSTVICSPTVDKPVAVTPSLQADGNDVKIPMVP